MEPLSARLQARDGLQQLLLPAAGDARNAQDLAGVGREGHAVELEHAVLVPDREVLDHEPGLGVLRLGPLYVQR